MPHFENSCNVTSCTRKLTKEEKLALKLENKDKIGLNQIIKPIVYFVLCFALEMVNYFLLDMKTASGAKQLLPTYIMFDIGFWLLIAGLIFISSKNWLSNTLFYFFLIMQIVLCAVNATLHADFGYFFTWDMLGNGQILPILNYLGENGTHSEYIEGLMAHDMKKTADDLAMFFKDAV